MYDTAQLATDCNERCTVATYSPRTYSHYSGSY